MALDLAAMRAALTKLNSKGGENPTLWKPTEGDHKIRIVPLKKNPGNPFQELYFHFNLQGKTYLSPLSYGERDPLAEFSDALISDAQAKGQRLEKDEFKAAKQFFPQKRTYLPVVVRGEENKGVRFWAFGKQIYEQILAVMVEPDYGDITDPDSGFDIKVTFTPAEKTGKSFPETKITVLPRPTSLSADAAQKNSFLNEQPELLDAFTKVSYEELEKALTKLVEAQTGQSVAPAAEAEVSPTASSSAKKTEVASDVVEAFEKLFEE